MNATRDSTYQATSQERSSVTTAAASRCLAGETRNVASSHGSDEVPTKHTEPSPYALAFSSSHNLSDFRSRLDFDDVLKVRNFLI
jgi:hypothetical protein